jgi:hypothetical protein
MSGTRRSRAPYAKPRTRRTSSRPRRRPSAWR